MIILEEIPPTKEFYETYWGQRPFLVRQAIPSASFDHFIDGNTLAGLSLEEDVKSRIVTTAPERGKWECEHGPFDENRFDNIGDTNWSLLVQNVEQYHSDTANLLKHFNFTPRWLLDDIMVSFSATGGSVGPHTDSYHVFLVQGSGKRIWKVGNEPVQNEQCIEGLDLKVLKDGVDGEEIEVSMGDVIYIPPLFAHEGTTTDTAMTFSVGYLGPKMSELFIEYGHYLENIEVQDKRYTGADVNENSAGCTISSDTQKNIQTDLVNALQADNFIDWMVEYFSTQTESCTSEPRENTLTEEDIFTRLKQGDTLHKPEFVKIVVAQHQDSSFTLSAYGNNINIKKNNFNLIKKLQKSSKISINDIKTLENKADTANILSNLYNRQILFFNDDDLNQ